MLNAYTSSGGRLTCLDAHTQPALMKGAVWFDLCRPAPEDFAFVVRETGLALPEEADIVEIESSSRLSVEGQVLTLTMPVVSRENDGLHASACGFVLSPERLVTIRLSPSAVFEQFARARHDPAETDAGSLFVGLLEAMTYRVADELEKLRHELDMLSHEVFHRRLNGHETTRSVRGRDAETILQRNLLIIGRGYDTVTFLRDTQLGIGRIAGFVKAKAIWLQQAETTRLDALEKDVSSLNEFSVHLTDKLQFLQDGTLGLINIAQNSLIKVLTIVSIVGIPPTLIAGIYGMNFKNIPELHWDYGYVYVWVIMILSAILPLLWFRKKGWV